MDLQAMRIEENLRNLKTTVLYRKDGIWHDSEVAKFCNGLGTEVSHHPQYPEYLIIFGHYTKEQTLEAIGGGQAYTAKQVTGADRKELPFRPGFI